MTELFSPERAVSPDEKESDCTAEAPLQVMLLSIDSKYSESFLLFQNEWEKSVYMQKTWYDIIWYDNCICFHSKWKFIRAVQSSTNTFNLTGT